MTLIEEAEKCTNCLDWLHHCKAECCLFYEIKYHFTKPRLGSMIKLIINNPTEDWIYYHRLHGCRIELLKNNKASMTTRFLKGEMRKDVLRIYQRCMYLSPEGKCEVHDAHKPLICKDLDVKTIFNGRYIPTPNCFYTIQAMQQKLKKEDLTQKNAEIPQKPEINSEKDGNNQ